jgi:hypothetical protein
MSKDEAWQEVESAFSTVHQQMCGYNCSCDDLLEQVKEALYV